MSADLSRAEVLAHALRIAREYVDQDITITLRQLYYQFVARGLTGNGQKVYKRIGEVLTAARYDGDFPVDWLTDSGREVRPDDATRSDVDVARALYRASYWIRGMPDSLIERGRWFGQPSYVSVWFEKEALSGVFGPVCDELGDAWELDALEPTVLRDLIREHIDNEFDDDIATENDALVEDRRADLRARMADPAWLGSVWP